MLSVLKKLIKKIFNTKRGPIAKEKVGQRLIYKIKLENNEKEPFFTG